MPNIFVYGTLIDNMPNFVRDAELVATEAEVSGYQLYNLGWFPGMLRSLDRNDHVFGQIWKIPAEGYERLDQYEGYHIDNPDASLYLRLQFHPKEILTKEAKALGAVEYYHYNGRVHMPPERRILSGRWKDVA